MQKIYNRLLDSESESWNYFNQLRDFWRSKSKLLEDFIAFLKEKSDLDKSYSKGLEKLSEFPLFQNPSGAFEPALKSVQNSLISLSSNFLIHSQYLSEELGNSIKVLLASNETVIKGIREQAKEFIIEREKFLKKNEVCKEKYLKSSQESGSQFGLLKYFQTQPDYLQEYLNANENLSVFNSLFKNELQRPVENFKEKLKERFQAVKYTLQMLISSEANWIYSIKMHVDNLAHSVAKMDPNEDLAYIDSLVMEFFDIGNKDCVAIENENINNIRSIIQNCWKSVENTEKSLELFKTEIKKTSIRKLFTDELNAKRKMNEFVVPEQTFGQLGALFNAVLDSLLVKNDFHCARQVIILSQTFFTQGKIFIYEMLVDHALWEKSKYWQELVENSINDEICKGQNFEENQEDPQEQLLRAKSIAVATLISYIDIMVVFRRESEEIYQIASKCKSKFLLSEEDICIGSVLKLCNEH